MNPLQKIEDDACEYASSRIDNSDDDWSFQWDKDFTAKFAELIFQECFKVMKDEDDYYGSWMGDVIKKHFGITEKDCK